MGIMTHERFVARFHSKINKNGPIPERFPELGPCWIWTASYSGVGYGTIIRYGRKLLTHRVSFSLHVGPIPDGMKVLHRCDNPPCCNPAHLFLGTLGDNNTDRHQKGRSNYARGEARSPHLTEDDVREMRRLRENGMKLRELETIFGIERSTVCGICRRHSWAHVV